MSGLDLLRLALLACMVLALLLSESLAEVAPAHPLRAAARPIAAACLLAATMTIAAALLEVLA